MTNEAVQYTDAPLNIYGSTIAGTFADPLTPPGFRFRNPPNFKRELAGKVVCWEFPLGQDNRGPQAQSDTYVKAYAGWSQTDLDTRFRGYLFNVQAVTTESQFASVSDGPVVFCDSNSSSFGTVLAQGSTANQCLATASVSGSDDPTYVTYNPGSAIYSLAVGPLNSTNRLLVGRTSATIDVHSATGTTAGTMHANLTGCWGMALSPTNATTPGTPTWVFGANGGIWVLASNVAITTAPTQTMSNVNDGGAFLGFETLENTPMGNRLYFLMPLVDRSTSAWGASGTVPAPCKLMSVNVDGLDLQEHQLPMTGIIYGRLWQRRVVVSDGQRVIAYDGKNATDLNIFGSAKPASGKKLLVEGIGGDHSALRVTVTGLPTISATGKVQDWEFDEAGRRWAPVSKLRNPSSASLSSASPFDADDVYLLHGPQTPYSRWLGYQFQAEYNDTVVRWARQFIPPRGINPFLTYPSNTTETSGDLITPIWSLPGSTAGHPSLIAEIDGRLIDFGTSTTNSVKVVAKTQTSTTDNAPATGALTRTFVPTEAVLDRIYKPYRNDSVFYRIQFQITVTTGANGVPIMVRGFTCLDDVIRSPEEVGFG